MKCDCIADTKERLKTRVLEPDMASERPKNGELKGVDCRNMALAFSSAQWLLMIPFTVEWNVKGRIREKTVNVAAQFCPFCGKEAK